jgi:hypothetical protein
MAESTDGLAIPPLPEIPGPLPEFKFGSENPKDPEFYQIGDDLTDYFPLIQNATPCIPSGFLEAMDKVQESVRKSHASNMVYLDSLDRYMESLTTLSISYSNLRVAEARVSAIRTRRLKLKASIIGSQPASSGETTPDPTGGLSEARRDRMQGIDVSKLPAGFGKRRASGAGTCAKRPKTPNEDAPEVKEPTPAVTP